MSLCQRRHSGLQASTSQPSVLHTSASRGTCSRSVIKRRPQAFAHLQTVATPLYSMQRSGHVQRSWFAQAASSISSQPMTSNGQEPSNLAMQLPPGDFSRVKKATYISSSVDLKGCPPEKYAEFAVIGRSNVGKSSLVNMLAQSSKLAKVSKEPGGYRASVKLNVCVCPLCKSACT